MSRAVRCLRVSPVTAYIALGANLGDRARNIQQALEKLGDTPATIVTRVSGNYENPAVGGPPNSPRFLNAAAQVETTLDPHALLRRLLEIEREMGRVRDQKWAPRIIDLDLLLYGDQVIRSADLTVPHPLMHERLFVLEPLAEIAEFAVHPKLQRNVGDLLSDLLTDDLPASGLRGRAGPNSVTATLARRTGYFDRLNVFDRVCAIFALLLAPLLLVAGVIGLFAPVRAHITLPPVVGVVLAFAGWGILKSVIVAIRAAWLRQPAAQKEPRGFPLD